MVGHFRRTPLHEAAGRGPKDVVHLLLDRGAQPNISEHTGRTPLLVAAFGGHKDVIKTLLDRGAEPNIGDINGTTPLSYALQLGKTDLANILMENGWKRIFSEILLKSSDVIEEDHHSGWV